MAGEEWETIHFAWLCFTLQGNGQSLELNKFPTLSSFLYLLLKNLVISHICGISRGCRRHRKLIEMQICVKIHRGSMDWREKTEYKESKMEKRTVLEHQIGCVSCSSKSLWFAATSGIWSKFFHFSRQRLIRYTMHLPSRLLKLVLFCKNITNFMGADALSFHLWAEKKRRCFFFFSFSLIQCKIYK